MRRRNATVSCGHGAEILPGTEPDCQADLRHGALRLPEQFLRFEQAEHARPAEAHVSDEVGHANRLVQVLAEVGNGRGNETLGIGRRTAMKIGFLAETLLPKKICTASPAPTRA
ncbi:MAG: hypothetical protein MUF81_08755 [Verrucomicrobia bacterium]|jgi:hypothetical protein|nr:hypothetical protein [Verrucomicrobiota bacterium]